ncbi:unnamed protein product [Polarella glacialis]|uniref:Uncharacterized protein n=1 Tax=Polarella glacialis TaxID=89957 RepID=A0A813HAC1_POLGL|nr:unnamed protein product [Polarella glacialis]CAE8636449.1 unnamed protein product [Polarella glacialis]
MAEFPRHYVANSLGFTLNIPTADALKTTLPAIGSITISRDISIECELKYSNVAPTCMTAPDWDYPNWLTGLWTSGKLVYGSVSSTAAGGAATAGLQASAAIVDALTDNAATETVNSWKEGPVGSLKNSYSSVSSSVNSCGKTISSTFNGRRRRRVLRRCR